ncbi:two-component sensor histidine kinase [Capsulimonas corticalis]|uniref:histidine kinase n=1 Tax=Capsulimonas corticalis TaxID=2219043 RepID=A0A402D5D1_9BACT|nr:ATP-binding protein [Capsulimonas corticalis]BDI29769.1 two-component sensor histidine kinase [Capsulimonas corticalis]
MTISRPRFSLNSVRVRITLWNVGILAFVLIVLGAVFMFSFRANVASAVDQGLAQKAHGRQHFFGGMPPDMTADVLAGRDPRPPHFGERFGPPQKQSKTPPPGGGPGDGPGDERFGEMRPRMFDLKGNALLHGAPLWDRTGFKRVVQGAPGVYSTIHASDGDVRVFSLPLQQNGVTLAVVQCANSLTHFQEEQARMQRILMTLIPFVLLIAGFGGAFLTDRALRPVREIAHAANKIEAEHLSQRLPVIGHDEFAEIAETFNGLLGRLETAFERQEQAFQQQQRFTADASHELRTPLTIIKANTSLALTSARTEEQLRKTLQTVDTAADRMNRIVQDLLLLARSDAGQMDYDLRPTPLAEIIEQALPSVQSASHAPVAVRLDPPDMRVCGQPDALVRLFSNLLENAARYTPQDGQITISSEAQGECVTIAVADTGEGVAPDHLPHITERFYRAEAARSRAHGGTGLGLAICQTIVDLHHGSLAIESTLGAGTTVRVTLPRA